MRVVYVINGLGTGGAERSLAEMLPALRAAGVEVTVVCLFRREEGVQDQVVRAGFDVRFLRGTGWVTRLRALRSILRTEQPDIVHTTIFEADILGRVAAVGLSTAVVSSLVNTSYDARRRSDPGVSGLKLAAARTLDGWTARRLADHHHAITHAVREASVRALRLDPERITVVERGRDPRRLGAPSAARRTRVRQELGLTDEVPVILNVGRQEFQKGQVHLLEAMQVLAARRPDAVLVQAGRRGHASAQISALAMSAPLAGRVRLLGHREDVPDLLAAADVFAFPSLYEGLGGAVVEAMALGLPIVATSIPALREVTEEGANALLVPPANPDHLAAALETVLDDAALRARFGARSQDIFYERFTLERSTARLVELYQRLLG